MTRALRVGRSRGLRGGVQTPIQGVHFARTDVAISAQNAGRAETRINWILRQLKDAPCCRPRCLVVFRRDWVNTERQRSMVIWPDHQASAHAGTRVLGLGPMLSAR